MFWNKFCIPLSLNIFRAELFSRECISYEFRYFTLRFSETETRTPRCSFLHVIETALTETHSREWKRKKLITKFLYTFYITLWDFVQTIFPAEWLRFYFCFLKRNVLYQCYINSRKENVWLILRFFAHRFLRAVAVSSVKKYLKTGVNNGNSYLLEFLVRTTTRPVALHIAKSNWRSYKNTCWSVLALLEEV